jgi:hypothetical protein
LLRTGDVIDNRTICDVFGVANMGGIRVNKSRNLIVLISNNTDPTYRNEWKADVLHFVGMGSIGPQKLDRQNKTLANATKGGAKLHLFQVFEKSRYVYFGEVELADEPYMSDQHDARTEKRFVWIFPLSRMASSATTEVHVTPEEASLPEHLPFGAYAVIGSDLTEQQVALVSEALDRLKDAGVPMVDQRDVDSKRYEKALCAWEDAVLDRVRSHVRELIAKRRHAAANQGRSTNLVDDELKINAASSEQELRDALKFLDRDDLTSINQVFEEARGSVPMPDPPEWLEKKAAIEPITTADFRPHDRERADADRFRSFT